MYLLSSHRSDNLRISVSQLKITSVFLLLLFTKSSLTSVWVCVMFVLLIELMQLVENYHHTFTVSGINSNIFSHHTTKLTHTFLLNWRNKAQKAKSCILIFLTRYVLHLCLSDGLVIVGVHSAKFPNEKVSVFIIIWRMLHHIMSLLNFCNSQVSTNMCNTVTMEYDAVFCHYELLSVPTWEIKEQKHTLVNHHGSLIEASVAYTPWQTHFHFPIAVCRGKECLIHKVMSLS